ncbi:MAG: c-type cytochrome [Acidobacteria bacterium]|nr:c-type cytochrome [Acidobacteriota bacterium]
MFNGKGRGRTLLSLALVSVGLVAQDAEAQFKKQCMSCHTVGAGAKVGPDLKGLAERRTKDWATGFMMAPGSYLDRGDATATELLKAANGVKMPDLGITAGEAEAIWKLVDDATKAGKVIGSAGIARPVTPADIANGRLLFEGRKHFAKGAPACLSCHSASSAGFAGGGSLGPDLTAVSGKMGKGLASAIETPAFPTMQNVFAKAPLTAEEAFQVAAFLGSVSKEPPAKKDIMLPIVGLIGLVGGLQISRIVARRRFKGVRSQLKPKA